MVSSAFVDFHSVLTSLGITPGVKPDDLKFYFEEIHRLAGS
jgi:hypothetical protein